LGTLTSWNPLGHSRPVMGLLYLSVVVVVVVVVACSMLLKKTKKEKKNSSGIN